MTNEGTMTSWTTRIAPWGLERERGSFWVRQFGVHRGAWDEPCETARSMSYTSEQGDVGMREQLAALMAQMQEQ